MKYTKKIEIICCLFFVLFLFNPKIVAQKIDTDSLLNVIIKDMKTNNNYEKNIQKALLGKKLAPNYLDYHLLLGRNHELLNNRDSARYYYSYVIDKNPLYEEAFSYLIKMDLEDKNYNEAAILIDKAIAIHPKKKTFYLQKIQIYEAQKDTKTEYEYLKTLDEKFPNDEEINQALNLLESKIKSDLIGLNYNITTIKRKDYGPWQIGNIEYIRQRNWGSLIGRINYANRYANSEITAQGINYELESYFFTGKNSYSFVSSSYSSDLVFPKFRLGYSYNQIFNKGWEAEAGLLHIETENTKIETLSLSGSKYIGSYWINFRTFYQYNGINHHPSLQLTTRYYLETKYDYISFITGYGTSPVENNSVGQFDQRISLNSFRAGGGYNKLFQNHFISGIRVTYNYQEYIYGKYQNEIEFSFSLHYKF